MPVDQLKSALKQICISAASLFAFACIPFSGVSTNVPEASLFFLASPTIIPTLPVTSGIYVRYDASQVTLSGSNVSTWPDIGPNALDLPTWTNPPTYVTNVFSGQPAVRFPASGTVGLRRTSGSTGLSNNTFTFFVVFRTGTAGVVRHLVEFGNGGCGAQNAIDLYVNAANNFALDAQGSSGIVSSATALAAGTHTVIIASDEGAPQTSLYANGNLDGQVAFNGGFNRAPMIWMGTSCAGNGSDDFDGDVGEIVMYNRLLSSTEIRSLECYARDKFGATISHACP
ncbi:MAG: LamG domain-containing protein [Spirochaetia bacterium]|nr:LamG domain-containing protein [Spirochaetia bacterium]